MRGTISCTSSSGTQSGTWETEHNNFYKQAPLQPKNLAPGRVRTPACQWLNPHGSSDAGDAPTDSRPDAYTASKDCSFVPRHVPITDLSGVPRCTHHPENQRWHQASSWGTLSHLALFVCHVVDQILWLSLANSYSFSILNRSSLHIWQSIVHIHRPVLTLTRHSVHVDRWWHSVSELAEIDT